MKIDGALFTVDKVAVTEGAKQRCVYLQKRAGKGEGVDEDLMVSVHSSILLKLHATGQHGEILPSDRILNRNNITRNSGRVLSVIGERFPLIVITELPSGDTLITTPQEV